MLKYFVINNDGLFIIEELIAIDVSAIILKLSVVFIINIKIKLSIPFDKFPNELRHKSFVYIAPYPRVLQLFLRIRV